MFAKSKLVIFGCILLIFLSGCDSTNTGLIVENPIFLCEGTPVENSTLCSGDNVGLIHNTPVTLAVSCTDAVKCEYVCDTGYKSIQNICIKSYVGPDTNVSVRTFSCTGVIPNNSNLCDNDDYNLTLDTPAVLATSCTPEKKCEYVCKEGYTNKDGNCVIVDFV